MSKARGRYHPGDIIIDAIGKKFLVQSIEDDDLILKAIAFDHRDYVLMHSAYPEGSKSPGVGKGIPYKPKLDPPDDFLYDIVDEDKNDYLISQVLARK